MSTAIDLCGCGIPDVAARRLGVTQASLTGVGTAQTGGTAILSGQTAVNATAASSQTAFVLPADAEYYRAYFVYNSSGTTALIYPSSGYAINAVAADSSVSIATLQTRIFWRVGALQWASVITS